MVTVVVAGVKKPENKLGLMRTKSTRSLRRQVGWEKGTVSLRNKAQYTDQNCNRCVRFS